MESQCPLCGAVTSLAARGKAFSRRTRKGLKRKSRRLYRRYFTCGKVEELERKARFPARSAGNAPKKFLGFYPDEIP